MSEGLTIRLSSDTKRAAKAINLAAKAMARLRIAFLRCKLSDLLQRRGWPRWLAILVTRYLPVWSLPKLWSRLRDRREWL